jgi:hypothetical protein
VPATADTVCRIATLSKSLTATAAMRLVEEHRVDLDAPVQKYCPAFPTKQWPITVRDVLTHQSGIRHYKNDDESINTRHYTSINEAQGPAPIRTGYEVQLHQLRVHCARVHHSARVDTVSTRITTSRTQSCSTSATSHRVAVPTRLPAISACSWWRCMAASWSRPRLGIR